MANFNELYNLVMEHGGVANRMRKEAKKLQPTSDDSMRTADRLNTLQGKLKEIKEYEKRTGKEYPEYTKNNTLEEAKYAKDKLKRSLNPDNKMEDPDDRTTNLNSESDEDRKQKERDREWRLNKIKRLNSTDPRDLSPKEQEDKKDHDKKIKKIESRNNPNTNEDIVKDEIKIRRMKADGSYDVKGGDIAEENLERDKKKFKQEQDENRKKRTEEYLKNYQKERKDFDKKHAKEVKAGRKAIDKYHKELKKKGIKESDVRESVLLKVYESAANHIISDEERDYLKSLL